MGVRKRSLNENALEVFVQELIEGLRAATPASRQSLFEGAKLAHIDSCCYAEDGKTYTMMVELEDRRLAMITLAPGEPIVASILAPAGGGR